MQRESGAVLLSVALCLHVRGLTASKGARQAAARKPAWKTSVSHPGARPSCG